MWYDETELYEKYQSDLRRIEEVREDSERKRRRLETRREAIRAQSIKDRAYIEKLLNSWGECQDSGMLLADFEDATDREYLEQQKREEKLQEENRKIQSEIAACESWYNEERNKMQEEI